MAEEAQSNPSVVSHGSNVMVQVVDDRGDFTANFNKLITQNWEGDILSKGFDYYIVAILGPQSSGKSTLLNLLFGTSFEIMDREKGRNQTTKGVWLSKAKEADIFVMDVEGTDSRERGDQMASFERKTSLFSLVLAEILLINIWANDIGRYNAANYGILKTVFELNLQLFQKKKSRKTLLLFAIRDHVASPLEKLKEQILKDMSAIWTSLQKPPEYVNSAATDFFDLDFYSFPHKELQAEQFSQAIENFRLKFIGGKADEHFYKASYRTDVPADGLAHFAEHVWETIKTNKDLDLPTEKEMLAMFRCEEIMESAYAAFATKFTPIRTKVLDSGMYVEQFGAGAADLLSAALAQYDAPASRYHKEVAAKKRELLITKIQTEFRAVFNVLVTRARQRAQEKLLSALSSALPSDKADRSFVATVSKVRDEVEKFFADLVREAKLPDSDWSVETESEELRKFISTAIEKEKDKHLNLLADEMKAKWRSEIGSAASERLDQCGANLWPQIRSIYATGLENLKKDLSSQLAGFELSDADVSKRLADFDKRSQTLLRELVKSKAEFLMYKMEKRFDENFRYDERGLPKRWKPDEDVSKLFLVARQAAEGVLEQFALMRMHAELDRVRVLPKEEKTDRKLSSSTDSLPTEESTTTDSSPNLETIDPDLVIYSRDKAMQLRDQFRKSAESAYMQALRDQEHVASKASVPIALIVLMIILGWNEFVMLLKNPLYMILLIFLGGIGFVVHKLGMTGPILAVLTMGVNSATHRAADYMSAQHIGPMKAKND